MRHGTKHRLLHNLTPGIWIFLGLFFLLIAPIYAAESEATAGGVMEFLRGHTWQYLMEWLNFIILMLLLWNFVIKKLLLPAVDENLTDIETRLSQEESQRREFQQKVEELKGKLENLGEEETRILQEATQQTHKIREQVIESAREQELRILGQVDLDAAAHFREGLDDLKGRFFSGLTGIFVDSLSEEKMKTSLKKYASNPVSNLGGRDGK